ALGLANLMLDAVLPPYRATLPELQAYIPIALGLLVVVYVVFFIRQFNVFQFSTKLLVVLLSASLIPVFGLGLYANQTARLELEDAASTALATRADLQSAVIGENLIKQAELLQTLALNDIIEDAAVTATSEYTATVADIQVGLRAKNAAWRAARDANDLQAPLLQAVVANPAVTELHEFSNTYPELVDVVITDRYGALVAAETPNYAYFLADENWWKAAYASGNGAIYFGDTSGNPFGAAFGVPIALPIFANDSNEVMGVIRATYKAEAILNQIGALEFDQSGHLDLILPGNLILESTSTAPLAKHLSDTAASSESVAVDIEVEGVQSFAASRQVHSVDPEEGESVNQLGWRVFAHQSRAEIMLPVEAQSRTLLLVTVFIGIVVALGAAGLGQVLLRPINQLTRTAEQISTGDLTVRAAVESSDEIGQLALSFNRMTAQLRDLIANLEERVQARTEQLRASADVGRATTSILDADQLLHEAVNLITNRFGFYYAAIFTLDTAGKTAVLREATGEAGRILKERGHQLAVTDLSMVGTAIIMRQPRIALDVSLGAVRVANPLLPNTRSEIALPLRAGQRVIGVLDVQSEQVNAFDEASADVLQTMADQLAVALINAETFSQVERQAHVMAVLNQLSRELAQATSLAEIGMATAKHVVELAQPNRLSLSLVTASPNQLIVYPLDLTAENTLSRGQQVEISQTITGDSFRRGETVYTSDLNTLIARHPLAASLYAEGSRALLTIPLRASQRVLGTLDISSAQVNGFSPEQIAQLEQVAAQLTVALDNYNLSEQTRTALQELDTANRRLVGQAWERYVQSADTLSGEWRDGQWLAAPNTLLASTGKPQLQVPIKVRGETIGEFSVQTDDQRVWTSDDMAFAQALIDQVGQVIENARLLEETGRFALREQRIRQITTRIRAASDVQAVLEATTTELAQSLGVSRAIMRLTMSETAATGGSGTPER
nr:GAF domain-containing protein [Thermoflexales bacterium]